MKTVRLLVRKGTNDANSVVQYDDASADWMVANGYGVEIPAQPEPKASDSSDNDDAETPAPRRGRPRKADKS